MAVAPGHAHLLAVKIVHRDSSVAQLAQVSILLPDAASSKTDSELFNFL